MHLVNLNVVEKKKNNYIHLYIINILLSYFIYFILIVKKKKIFHSVIYLFIICVFPPFSFRNEKRKSNKIFTKIIIHPLHKIKIFIKQNSKKCFQKT